MVKKIRRSGDIKIKKSKYGTKTSGVNVKVTQVSKNEKNPPSGKIGSNLDDESVDIIILT